MSSQILPRGLKDPSLRTIINPQIRDSVYFLKYGAETGGAYLKIRIALDGDGGVLPHRHASYAETFHALDDKLGVLCKDGEVVLQPGESRTVQKNEMHRFHNLYPDKTVNFEVTIAPAHPGFEKSLHIIYGLAKDGMADERGVPKRFEHLCVVTVMADMSSNRWVWVLLGPLMWLIAMWAKWRGEEERLVRKYYG